MKNSYNDEKLIPGKNVSKKLLIINMIAAGVYFSWWFNPNNIGNIYLYSLLFLGEVYHIVMALTFWLTIWPKKRGILIKNDKFSKNVDVFITVAGEPEDVVEKTAVRAKAMDYQNLRVHILNDGFVAKKNNWREIEALAQRIGVNCITRKIPGGAKAGNINHALKVTEGSFVMILDADMVPNVDFLSRTMPFFEDEKVGFVQTPQYYKNYYVNDVAGGAWEQQRLFFGPIMRGKDNSNSAFICGTNVVIRREALEQVGGMNEKNIAEDFLTSLYIHQKKWKSIYIDQVLCEGLAPEDLLSYVKQQLRWARGSLEVLFGHNPIFKRGLSWRQKTEYLSSALYYLNGMVVLIDIAMPILFLLFGWQPVATTTTSFAIYFLPFMMLVMYTLFIVSGEQVTFRAISFTQSSWFLQLRALVSVLIRQNMGFSVTPKKAQSGNFIFLAYPHLAYVLLLAIGIPTALYREGLNPSVMTNIAWGMLNVIVFIPFIMVSINWRGTSQERISRRESYEPQRMVSRT